MQVKPALVQMVQPQKNVSSVSLGRQRASVSVSSQSTQQISVQARQFVANVAQNENLSGSQRQELINLAALTDAFVQNPAGRDERFSELAGLAVYLSEGADQGIPRWSVLTGLRFYSGFKTEVLGSELSEQQAQVQIQQQMETLQAQVQQDRAVVATSQQPVEPSDVSLPPPVVTQPIYQAPEAPEVVKDTPPPAKVDIKV